MDFMKSSIRLILVCIISLLLTFSLAHLTSFVLAEPVETSTGDSSTEESEEETSSLTPEEESSLEASKEASSIFESMSIEASKESQKAYDAFQKAHLYAGLYIKKDLSDVDIPEGFSLESDAATFSSLVDVFYHPDYNITLFYATEEQDGDYDFYLYDFLEEELFPYTTLNVNNEKYVVVTPISEEFIPGTFIASTSIRISSYSTETLYVPAYKVYDSQKQEVTLVMLQNDRGLSNFYIYETDSGFVTLTLFSDREATYTTEAQTRAETKSSAVKTTEISTYVPSTEGTESILKEYMIWFIIFGAVFLLMVIAIIVVVSLNKSQARQEEEIDLTEEDMQKPMEYLKQKRMMSSGYSNEMEDTESFDTSFENSFPEEMNIEDEDPDQKKMEELTDLEDQNLLEPDDYEGEEEKKPAVSEDTQQVDLAAVRKETSRFKQEDSSVNDLLDELGL